MADQNEEDNDNVIVDIEEGEDQGVKFILLMFSLGRFRS